MSASANSLRHLHRVLWIEPLIICGFGDVGSAVARASLRSGRHAHQVTVLEPDPALACLAEARGHRVIRSDPASAEALRRAGAGVAGTIIICLGDDRALDAIHAARSAGPQAVIKVALDHSDEEQAAIDAGADTVLNLSKLAGKLLVYSALGHLPKGDTAKPQ